MKVTEELKKTSKGQLKYVREVDPYSFQEWLDVISSPPKLSSLHVESPSSSKEQSHEGRLQPHKVDDTEKRDESKEDLEESKVTDNPDDHNEASLSLKKPPQAIPETVIPVSLVYGSSCLRIKNYEALWDNKAKESILAKQKEFEENTLYLEALKITQVQELEVQQMQQIKKLYEQTTKIHQKETAQTIKRVEKLKEDHRKHTELLDAKLVEGERKRLQLQEEERKRKEELEKRVTMMQSTYTQMKALYEQFLTMYNDCSYKHHLVDAAKKSVDLVQQLMVTADMIMQQHIPNSDLVQKLNNMEQHARNAFDFLKQQIEEAMKKGKAEDELAKQQQQQQQQQEQALKNQQTSAVQPLPNTVQPPSGSTAGTAGSTPGSTASAQLQAVAGDTRTTVVVAVVEEFATYKFKLREVEKSVATFSSNPQMKKYKFDLLKAVNTPINAISPVDGAHLRDKLQRLLHLLTGNQVDVLGKHISAKEVPHGIAFCKNLIAKMIVKKGDEQVSSKHESAFAIAMVAVGLWHEHPDLGDLLLAQFHSFCPYIVPYYIPRQDGISSEDYHRILGYKVDGGTIEAQDKFLKRMTGIMRLYAAILVSSPPRTNVPHPHGIEHAWIWLSRISNMDPQPDITATMMYDLLQVAGNALFQNYRIQFVKLLYILYKDFLPQMKKVAAAGGPVARLETFLETTLKNFKSGIPIPTPEGWLSSNFWFS